MKIKQVVRLLPLLMIALVLSLLGNMLKEEMPLVLTGPVDAQEFFNLTRSRVVQDGDATWYVSISVITCEDDGRHTPCTPHWFTFNPSKASVDENGMLKPIWNGIARICMDGTTLGFYCWPVEVRLPKK